MSFFPNRLTDLGPPVCTVCKSTIPPEPCHIAGILVDGRYSWMPSCQHVPVHGAQVRLGSPDCARIWLYDHRAYRFAVLFVERTGAHL